MRPTVLYTHLLFTASAFSLNDLAPRFFQWFTQAEGVQAVHAKHIQSETAMHMMKGTPLVGAPDDKKMEFARSAAGRAVADFMRMEQQQIGQWKIERIVEAAGDDFDAAQERERLVSEVSENPVVMFSFVDCPWCLLAKERLQAMETSADESSLPSGALRILEMEGLGRDGKRLRAAIALATGRTSLPAVFIGGKSVGGWTDGEPEGDDALCLAGSPGLEELAASGELRRLCAEATAAWQCSRSGAAVEQAKYCERGG